MKFRFNAIGRALIVLTVCGVLLALWIPPSITASKATWQPVPQIVMSSEVTATDEVAASTPETLPEISATDQPVEQATVEQATEEVTPDLVVTDTVEPTTSVGDQPVETVTIPTVVTSAPTLFVPTATMTSTATSTVTPLPPTSTPTWKPTEKPTLSPTLQPPVVSTAISTVAPTATTPGRGTRLKETFCQMNIDDAGDENPFTYAFSSVNAANIASFAWDFGDTTTASTQTVSHTYASVGTFTITLTCTPQAGFGAPIVLTGSIMIASTPVVDFDITPSDVIEALMPVTLGTVNRSEGGALTYLWTISTSIDPLDAAAVLYTATTENITFKFEQDDITGYPMEFYFHLTVTDGAGLSASGWKSVVFNPPDPKATFNMSPNSGTAPLTVTFLGEDLGEGPISSWEWDFNDDTVTDATGVGPHDFTFTAPGAHRVTLRYMGPAGAGGNVTKTVGIFPAGNPVQSVFVYENKGTVAGGIEVCFTNNSTGPVVTSEWDFNGDGVFDATDNNKVVCHLYAAEGPVTVNLRVSDASGDSTSTSTQNLEVIASPVASFTVTPGTNITWGTNVSFTDTSTGIITSWAWDFNGDGTTDRTDRHPSNIALTSLGTHPIRLTVTGPGGASFVEVAVYVARLEVTCAFSGALNVLPGAGAQTYTSNIGSQAGRVIDYKWTITGNGAGLPATYTTQNISVDWNAIGYGSFQVTLEASTPDGSICSESKTVTRAWQGLDCQMTNNLPGTLYADGSNYTFTANVVNLDGRTVTGYNWFVDGALVQSGSSPSYSYQNTNSTAGLPASHTVRYEVMVNNGAGYNPPTTGCFDERAFTVQPWPTLVCSNISGTTTPLPVTADNTGRSYTYSANISGTAGRTVSYQWAAVGGNITSPNPRTGNNQATVQWSGAASELNPAAANDNISVVVTVTNPDKTTVDCSMNRNIAVGVTRLACALPSGDTTPVVGETVNYTPNVSNVFGRPETGFTWTVEQLTPVSNTWTSSTKPLAINFPDADATYRIQYFTSVGTAANVPADSCTSGWQTITVYGTGLNFECEGNLTGNITPNNPAAPYAYSIDMDNGNRIDLRYRWILRDSAGTDHLLSTTTSDTDGIITSPSFSLTQLAPLLADRYTLRVEASAVDTAISSYTCSKSLNLTVGTINVDYSYNAGTWSNTAVPVNQPICLTNTSTMVPGTINDLNYTWTVSGSAAVNSWGTNTSTEQQPAGCISFSAPGTYTIVLNGVTDSGLRSDSETRTFNVYGLQSILINRTGSSFAGSTQTFTANGTNITGSYQWTFYRIDNGETVVGTLMGQTVNRFFNTAGTYRAEVRGTGPLGMTTASLEFKLLSSDGLTAGFTASQYGGMAPMTVCYTDTSISGSPIAEWAWDLNADGTYELIYDSSNKPANICHTYTTGGMTYPVRLRVRNANFTDTATNTIRTYTEMESSATFSVIPQGGGAFCFDAILTGGVTVTGWEFGDGTSGPGNDPICHTYGASGSYVVRMKITDGPNDGEVIRIVNVVLTNNTPPSLNASGTCTADVQATFTLTNTGGAMTTPDQITIRDANGSVVMIAPLLLAANSSTSYTVGGHVGEITLTTTDIVLSVDTDCAEPPILTGSATCLANGAAVFTLINTSSETAASQSYEVRDGANTLISSGTLNIPVGGSQDVTVTGVWGSLRLTSSGPQGPTTVLDVSSNCDEPPLLSISHVCQINGAAVFTVSNTSTDTAANQSYEIRDGANALIASGTLSIPTGGTQDVTVTGVWGLLTFTSSGGVQGTTTVLNHTSDCDEPPILTATAVCALDGTATFTVWNTSSDTAANQFYTVQNTSTGTVITSGTLSIPTGGSQDVVVSGVYVPITLTSTGTQGDTTEVSIDTDCNQPPVLAISHVCQIDGAAVFTITNTSSESAASQLYEIHDSANTLIDSGTLNVPIGGSTNVTVTGVWGLLTFTSNGGLQGATTVLNHSSDCDEPPLLSISHICEIDGSAVFTVSNSSADTDASQHYEIRNSAGDVIDSGTLDVPVGGSTNVTVTGVWGLLTFTSDAGAQGPTTVVADTSDCDEPPLLSISHVCQIDGSAVFTVSNSSADTDASQPYEIRSGAGDLIDSGTLNVAVGGTTDVTVTGVWGRLTFTSAGVQGITTDISDTSNCDEPPLLNISHVCQIDGSAVFTVSNSSADTDASQPYEIRSGAGDLIDSGTLNVAVGGTTDVTVSGVWGPLTFTSVGVQGVTTEISDTSDCDEPPLLIANVTCTLSGIAVFTIHNDSQDTAAHQTYEVRNDTGDLIDSGTLNIAVGGTVEVIISNVHTPLTLTSTGTEGITTVVSVSTNCDEPPLLTASTTCQIDGTAVFTITNTSTETAADQPYEIRDTANNVVDSGTLNVTVGGSAEITVSDVYTALTLTSTGIQGVTTSVHVTTDCDQPPVLTGSAVCTADGIATFTVENTSSESNADQPYTVTNSTGEVVQSGSLSVPKGGKQSISVTEVYSEKLSFSTTGAQGISTVLDLSTVCDAKFDNTPDNDDPTTETGTTVVITDDGENTDNSDDDDSFTKRLPPMDLTPQSADTTLVARPAWEGISIGGDVCPVWLIYHTNMTGDWEVFRLGDGDDPRIAAFDPNLSQGVGPDVVDMAPSRSPDAEWIVFTSNRDSAEQENWELYVASIDNTVIRRVTYNTFAKDIDPAWSPDGRTIVFETDRDGNWELYRFDLATGIETRLTDDASSDINAFWTPDSQHVIFQSDRSGKWQLYKLTIATGEVMRLSDGATEDHDASVSFDGEKIAFRAYQPDSSKSGIYVMNIDGSGRQLISHLAGSASNHTWSRDDALIAYQSNLDGDLDIYAYEVKTEKTRLVTDNEIPDYAPTWLCSDHTIVFTSDVLVDANIFNTPADPIEADPILVDKEATQMTFSTAQDIYPENYPSEENASREGNVPPMIGKGDLVIR